MSELIEVINVTEEKFLKIAPKSISFEAEKGFAIQLLSNNTQLMSAAKSCPRSLQQAVANVAAVGLSLNPAKKEAYLITRNMKLKGQDGRDKWETRIFLEPSYMGLCNIATSSGRIEWVQAEVVRDKDQFMFNGVGEKPTHSFDAFRDRGDIIGVYCVAKTNSGDHLTGHMDIDKINSIMERSESIKYAKANNKKPFGPWVSDFEEMAKKSVIRQQFKTWPKTGLERLEQAVAISNENEGFEPIQTSPDISADRKEYFDGLITKSDAFEMFAFSKTCPTAEFSNLYNSFKRGEKGKFKKIIDDLIEEGRSVAFTYRDEIEGAIASNDDLALEENISELTKDQLFVVCELLNVEAKQIVESIQYKQAS